MTATLSIVKYMTRSPVYLYSLSASLLPEYALFCFTDEDTEDEKLTWPRSRHQSCTSGRDCVQTRLGHLSSLRVSCLLSLLVDGRQGKPTPSTSEEGSSTTVPSSPSWLPSRLSRAPENNLFLPRMRFSEPPAFGQIKQKLNYWRAGCCF